MRSGSTLIPRTGLSAAGMTGPLPCPGCSVGSCELCQPRMWAHGEACYGEQPESRGPAQRAADLALGRTGRNGEQRDPEVVILIPLAGGFPGRLSAAAWLLQSCGCVRVAAKTMASGDLGGPRPGRMTVRDRPAGICPDPLPRIAGAGRWPSPACVIRCALLPLLGPERVEARRSGDPILRWPRRCGADAAGRCMTGQRRAGPGSHRKRSAGAVSGLPGSSGPGTGRTRPAICWRATTARIPEWAARSGTPQRTHASAMSGVGRSANAPGMATSRVQYPAPPAARVCGPGRAP